MNDKISIIVASHKAYEFPSDSGYIPIHVGAATSDVTLDFQRDDTDINISELNSTFCEMTGLYWLWMNCKESSAYGLSHYRRYFKFPDSDKNIVFKDKEVASTRNLLIELENYDVLVPYPRNYVIESVRNHYSNAHYYSDLVILEKIIMDKCSDYYDSYDFVMKHKKIRLFNMFVMKKEYFEQYCSWLFPILFELEKNIPYKEYGPYQSRVIGFLSERLFNIWLKKNENLIRVKELPVVNTEGENLLSKAVGLLERKFLNKKQN